MRASVPSRDSTRGSRAIAAWNWPCPASTQTTSAAPRARRTWVNPPVEAPTSRQILPGGIEAEGIEGGGQLDAAARDPRIGRRRFDPGAGPDGFRSLADDFPIDTHETGGDGFLRLGAARKELAFHKRNIGAWLRNRFLFHGRRSPQFNRAMIRLTPRRVYTRRAVRQPSACSMAGTGMASLMVWACCAIGGMCRLSSPPLRAAAQLLRSS